MQHTCNAPLHVADFTVRNDPEIVDDSSYEAIPRTGRGGTGCWDLRPRCSAQVVPPSVTWGDAQRTLTL